MTTKGQARGPGIVVRVDPFGDLPLRDLGARISELETLRGEPLIVEARPGLDPANQRLLASLGVVVRFVDDPRPDRGPVRRSRGPDRETIEAAVRDALDRAPNDRLTRAVREAWDDERRS